MSDRDLLDHDNYISKAESTGIATYQAMDEQLSRLMHTCTLLKILYIGPCCMDCIVGLANYY